MSLFNFGSKSKLGIDIGTASIKIIELEEAARLKLKNYGLFELGSGDEALNVGASNIIKTGDRPLQLNDDEIIWGIKETIARCKMNAKDAVASIQSFSTFSTVITLPYLSEADIAKTIPFEAKKYIPLPLSEVVLDWSIINSKTPQAPAAQTPTADEKSKPQLPPLQQNVNVEVFLVAVPKDEANRYQTIIKGAGLNLRALELENTAMARAVLGNDLSPAAIINIGGRSTSIVIIDNGVERLGHNYEVGGFEITKSIARSMNVSLKRAEELKRTMGMGSTDGIAQVAGSLVDLIVFEAKKTIHNYEDAHKTKINKIFLVGGLANMPGFPDYFQNKLGSEVLIGNPTARIVIPTELEGIRTELNTTFSVALGCAMRKI